MADTLPVDLAVVDKGKKAAVEPEAPVASTVSAQGVDLAIPTHGATSTTVSPFSPLRFLPG